MPFGDGTGPMGMGQMTGRAAGYCAGFGVPGYMNLLLRRGLGRGPWGRGPGRGWQHWVWAAGLPGWLRQGWWGTPLTAQTVPPQTEKQWLKKQAEFLQARLDEIRKRLSEPNLRKPHENRGHGDRCGTPRAGRTPHFAQGAHPKRKA